MIKLFWIVSLVFLGISSGNAQDNNLFMEDDSTITSPVTTPVVNIKPKARPPLLAPPQQKPIVETAPPSSPFVNFEYWELGKPEERPLQTAKIEGEINDADTEPNSTPDNDADSEVVTSEAQAPVLSSPIPKPRPKVKPTSPPKVKSKKQKPAQEPAPPKKTKTSPSGGLRCDRPKGVAAACSQNGIREGLEDVINDCNTVRCYLRLFHYETSCRPYLTHQAIVTAYGMCSIEKDKNLRKRFGADCSRIDTVDSQIKCCRKMMKTVGKKYFQPVKIGRMPKCE